MAREHLICEYCRAAFDSYQAYQQHKAGRHAQAEAERLRLTDEESHLSFPASDTPASTNPTVRVGTALVAA